jgi:hypothetical protein
LRQLSLRQTAVLPCVTPMCRDWHAAGAGRGACNPASFNVRAYRYPLQLPLRYRSIGDQTWSTGTTTNISRSGVLFRGEKPIDIETEIEMDIVLSAMSAGADVVCRARVVRAERAAADEAPILAAAFSNFRLEPAQP